MRRHVAPWLLVSVLGLTACKTVVTTTTDIRPARYAVLEFERPLSHDNAVAYAQQALKAEKIKIESVDEEKATVIGGPQKIAATGGQPALEATITITATTTGANSRVRIYATSVIEKDAMGGVDARLMELAQRIEKRMDLLIGQ